MKKLIALAAAIGATAAAPPSAASAQRIFAVCHNPGARPRPTFDFRIRPARCNSLGVFSSNAESVNLVQLRWRDWGRPAAMFTGIERGFHLPFAHSRVGGVAFRIVTWRGRRVYSRLRVSSRSGSMTVVLNRL